MKQPVKLFHVSSFMFHTTSCMSTTRLIAHNTLAQLAGKIVSTALGLIAIGMMTRYLGTEQFGWYVTAISFLQFIGILTDFGLIPVSAQMLSEPGYDKQTLLKNLLGFRLVTAVVFLGLAPVIALFFPYPPEVKIAIAFSTISFLSVAINQILTGYLQTQLRMQVYAVGEIVSRIVLVLGLVLFIRMGASFIPIMWVIVAATATHTIVLWLGARKYVQIGFAYDKNIWRVIVKKMWPVAISIMFNVVYLKGDIVLLSVFRMQTEVGLYGAAYRVLDIVSQMAMMIMGVIMPLLAFAWSRGLKEEFRIRYQQAFDLALVIAVPGTVGIALLSERIIVLVAGPEYTAAGLPLALLSVAVFGVYLGAVFGHTAVAINKQKQTIWIYASDAVITLIGYLIFIPRFGMTGAALMTVFSELYAGFFLFLTIRHYTQERLQMKTFGKILFASVVMSVVLFALRDLHIILLVLLGALVYGVVLVAIRGISKETLREIIRL